MKTYSVQVSLLATFEVTAADSREAERLVRDICDGGIVLAGDKAEPTIANFSGDVESDVYVERAA